MRATKNQYTKQYMDELETLRKKIDQIDNEIIMLFAKRFSFVKKIGEYKKKHNMQITNKNRQDEKLKTLITKGRAEGISTAFVRTVWQEIFAESYRLEK